MKKYQGSWGWVSVKALLGWRVLKNNCRCQRQSFPTSFRPSRDAKYTELEAVYLFFFFLSYYLLDTVQTAETKYQKCLKSLWPFTANCELCPLNSNFYVHCQHRLHAAAFSSSSQFIVYRGTASQGPGRRGSLSTFQPPLQVQNTKSPCCALLRNTCKASKAAWNTLSAHKASILQPSAGAAHIPAGVLMPRCCLAGPIYAVSPLRQEYSGYCRANGPKMRSVKDCVSFSSKRSLISALCSGIPPPLVNHELGCCRV